MLFKAGLHVPSIPLFEVVGKALIVVPLQTGLEALKRGVTMVEICTSTVLVSVQLLASVMVTV